MEEICLIMRVGERTKLPSFPRNTFYLFGLAPLNP